MSNMLLILLGSVTAVSSVLVTILFFWKFVQCIIIMGKKTVWWGIAGFLFSPIAHVIFHISNANSLSQKDKKAFKLYYFSLVMIAIFGIALAIIISAYQRENMTVEDNVITVEDSYIANTEYSPLEPVHTQEYTEPTEDELSEIHFQTIFNSHPDASALVDSRDFSLWLQSLEPAYHSKFNRILAEGNAQEVIYMLNEFKAHQTQQDYERDLQYQQVQQMKQRAAEYSRQFPDENSAQAQTERNKKTMQVFIEAQALEQKRAKIRKGYSEQEAEKYAAKWKQQKLNQL